METGSSYYFENRWSRRSMRRELLERVFRWLFELLWQHSDGPDPGCCSCFCHNECFLSSEWLAGHAEKDANDLVPSNTPDIMGAPFASGHHKLHDHIALNRQRTAAMGSQKNHSASDFAIGLLQLRTLIQASCHLLSPLVAASFPAHCFCDGLWLVLLKVGLIFQPNFCCQSCPFEIGCSMPASLSFGDCCGTIADLRLKSSWDHCLDPKRAALSGVAHSWTLSDWCLDASSAVSLAEADLDTGGLAFAIGTVAVDENHCQVAAGIVVELVGIVDLRSMSETPSMSLVLGFWPSWSLLNFSFFPLWFSFKPLSIVLNSLLNASRCSCWAPYSKLRNRLHSAGFGFPSFSFTSQRASCLLQLDQGVLLLYSSAQQEEATGSNHQNLVAKASEKKDASKDSSHLFFFQGPSRSIRPKLPPCQERFLQVQVGSSPWLCGS